MSEIICAIGSHRSLRSDGAPDLLHPTVSLRSVIGYHRRDWITRDSITRVVVVLRFLGVEAFLILRFLSAILTTSLNDAPGSLIYSRKPASFFLSPWLSG